jgi:uroporphyrinogen decarboxylase
MNGRDNVLKALRGELPACVPTFEWDINSLVLEKLIGENDIFKAADSLGLDGIVFRPDYTREFLDEDTFIDEWKCRRRVTRENISIITENPIQDIRRHREYQFPDPRAEHRFDRLRKACGLFGDTKAVILNVRDVFSDIRDLAGYENALIALLTEPEYTGELIDRVVEYNFTLAETARREFGIEIVATTDDIAGNRGLIMSPDTYFSVLAPRFKRAIAGFKSLGCYCIKHCDGNVTDLIEHWIESGVDCMDPIDPNGGMDLKKVKQEYGSRICLKGNIDCQGVLVSGTEEEVDTAVRRAIEDAAGGGGYILSSSNMIHSGVKPENYKAMINAVKKYGRTRVEV